VCGVGVGIMGGCQKVTLNTYEHKTARKAKGEIVFGEGVFRRGRRLGNWSAKQVFLPLSHSLNLPLFPSLSVCVWLANCNLH